MNTRAKLVLGAILLAAAGQSVADESLLESVVKACEGDLQKYCSTVTPGEGRLLHCVAAHEDKLSLQCDYALYQAATLLEQLTVAIVYIAESCENEIRTYCRDVEVGEGRIIDCLDENEDQLGAACQRAIDDTVGE